jgi:hypothetical protein
MMGCLNVLSRLKNPGNRIIPSVIDESLFKVPRGCRFRLPLALPGEQKEKRGMAEESSDAFRYYDHFTAQCTMLVNFEQFG